MKKFPEEMNKKEFKEFIKELKKIGKTEKGISFDEYITKQNLKELLEETKIKEPRMKRLLRKALRKDYKKELKKVKLSKKDKEKLKKYIKKSTKR